MRLFLLAIAALATTSAHADTIFKLNLTQADDGKNSFNVNQSNPDQGIAFNNVIVGKSPPLGRSLTVIAQPGETITGWFQSRQTFLAGDDYLTASYRALYFNKNQSITMSLEADHFNPLVGLVVRSGKFYISVNGKDTPFADYKFDQHYLVNMAVDFRNSYDNPQARVSVRELVGGDKLLLGKLVSSPWITFNAKNYNFKAASRFLLRLVTQDTEKKVGYGIRLAAVQMDKGYSLGPFPTPFPPQRCTTKNGKIVCN